MADDDEEDEEAATVGASRLGAVVWLEGLLGHLTGPTLEGVASSSNGQGKKSLPNSVVNLQARAGVEGCGQRLSVRREAQALSTSVL